MRPSVFFMKRIDRGGKPSSGRLIKSFYLTGNEFLSSAQGITNDGMFYYCTGTFVPVKHCGLAKIDMKTGVVIRAKHRYLPKELKEQDFNHYGGCTYFEGKIYVAVEDLHRQHPCLAVFDADTLCFTGRYRILGPEIQPNGNLPWCAADKENRLLYTGYFNDCDHINEFRIDDLEWIRSIPIDRVVQHTQGGEMYDGLIYISCHDSWKKKHIYAIDPLTGHVSTVMERHAGPHLVESEGLTICPCEDGSFFHQLDVIYPCGVAIRRYSKD